jgi:hypothetical protein
MKLVLVFLMAAICVVAQESGDDNTEEVSRVRRDLTRGLYSLEQECRKVSLVMRSLCVCVCVRSFFLFFFFFSFQKGSCLPRALRCPAYVQSSRRLSPGGS